MNLLIETAPDYLTVGGKRIKIKTDFFAWVKFFIACESGNAEEICESIFNIAGNITFKPEEFIAASMEWMFPKKSGQKKAGKNMFENKAPFDFDADGSVIYCELWRYFPKMMKRGITFHEGMELIGLLLHDENTALWHRAFARCGDFSKMDKERQKYWNKQRALYSLKNKSGAAQEDRDLWLYNAL